MNNYWRKEAMDVEWLLLMSEAKALGLTKEEVKKFLEEKCEKSSV